MLAIFNFQYNRLATDFAASVIEEARRMFLNPFLSMDVQLSIFCFQSDQRFLHVKGLAIHILVAAILDLKQPHMTFKYTRFFL